MRPLHAARMLLGALGCALALSAPAASLQVAPTSITLQPRQNADGLWLSNTGGDPLHAQVRVFRWTQVDGEERLEPTRDITISPPLIELPAGQRQLVRVIRLGAPPTDVETSYRVIVDELPIPETAPSPGGTGKRAGLEFTLRYSLPVFLLPASAGTAESSQPQPVLQAKVLQNGTTAQLEISNTGAAHAQVSELVFVDAAGRRHVVREGLAGYVLPGERKRWPIPASLTVKPAPAGVFKARINGEFADRDLLEQGIDSARPSGGR